MNMHVTWAYMGFIDVTTWLGWETKYWVDAVKGNDCSQNFSEFIRAYKPFALDH